MLVVDEKANIVLTRRNFKLDRLKTDCDRNPVAN